MLEEREREKDEWEIMYEFFLSVQCGVEEKYEVLNLLEFNRYGSLNKLYNIDLFIFFPASSTRKRMSVVVRTPKGEIKLLCKGAVS